MEEARESQCGGMLQRDPVGALVVCEVLVRHGVQGKTGSEAVEPLRGRGNADRRIDVGGGIEVNGGGVARLVGVPAAG